jgi:hypothetical protein
MKASKGSIGELTALITCQHFICNIAFSIAKVLF